MTTTNFWDYEVWSFMLIIGILLSSLLLANIMKQKIKFLKKTLIPSSVLGGIIILVLVSIYRLITKETFFNLPIFQGHGISVLETITYHCLGIGFIAMALRDTKQKFNKKRSKEIFDSGVTTVATYLIQGIFGLAVTVVVALVSQKIFAAAGLILPFGYGQGTGQALNYGKIYEGDYGFTGGANFGLTVAALGFLSASIGGVFCLNRLKKKGKIKVADADANEPIEPDNSSYPSNSSLDKFTFQVAIVIGIYVLSYFVMALLGKIEFLRSIVFGFNFLIGTFIAILFKVVFNKMKKAKIVKRDYVSNYLMNRLGGFVFDLMIVAGIAAIQLELLKDYWFVLTILGVGGAVITYIYVMFISKKLFPKYQYHQFMAMYGMLTGTASTGIILLREIDPTLENPASENLVYQNLPAILFGFPMLLLATFAPKNMTATLITLGLMIIFFIVLNILLFWKFIFKKKST